MASPNVGCMARHTRIAISSWWFSSRVTVTSIRRTASCSRASYAAMSARANVSTPAASKLPCMVNQ